MYVCITVHMICDEIGVPRHLRESHIEERKRQRQPDLSAYGPQGVDSDSGPKVSHGNRVSYGEVRNETGQ